jgi:hypothetical protein
VRATSVIAVAAGLEVLTAGLLVVAPEMFARLLLGIGLAGAGDTIGRLAGLSLLSLAIACWPHKASSPQTRRATFALLMFSLLCAVFLTAIGIIGNTVGLLLWPAAVTHATLGALILWQLAGARGV